MDGLLNVNKPTGWTSHDVVAKARSILKIKRIGHTGTLDPAASGVLVLCIGRATRIADYIAAAEKEYVATAVFGESTHTQDAEGEIIKSVNASYVTEDQLETVLRSFRGAQKQVPPMVSAVHHKGKRLYDLARRNVYVEREPRDIFIHELELLEFTPGIRAKAKLRVVCSKGTYIRTLCSDIGDKLQAGGYLSQLIRTRIGTFKLSDSLDLNGISPENIIPVKEALSHLAEIQLNEDEAKLAAHGGRIQRDIALSGHEIVLLTDPHNSLVALAKTETADGRAFLRPTVVFVAKEEDTGVCFS